MTLGAAIVFAPRAVFKSSFRSSLNMFKDFHSNLFISSFCQELLHDLPRSQLGATTVKPTRPQGSKDVQVSLKTEGLLRSQKQDSREGNSASGCRVADAEFVRKETEQKSSREERIEGAKARLCREYS